MAELMATIVSNLGVNCYMTSPLRSTRYLRYKFHGFHRSSACNGKVKEKDSSSSIHRDSQYIIIWFQEFEYVSEYVERIVLENALKKNSNLEGKIAFYDLSR